MGLIPANLRPALDALQVDVSVAALRDSIKDGWSYYAMAAGMADGFGDATGIASLGGAVWSAGAVTNGGVGGAVQISQGTGLTIGDMTAGGGLAAGFDGNTAQGWGTGPATVSGTTGRIGKDYGTGYKINSAVVYPVTSGGTGYSGGSGGTTTFTIEGSHNNLSWTPIGSNSVAANTGALTMIASTDTTTVWEYVRLVLSNTAGTNVYCSEVQFYEQAAAPPLAVTTSSIAFAAGVTPAECRLVSPVALGGGVIGTDCLFDASRDGATWAAVSLSDLGKYDASTRIVGGLADLSAQPAGSNLYWRWRTTSAYTLINRGVVLQWR